MWKASVFVLLGYSICSSTPPPALLGRNPTETLSMNPSRLGPGWTLTQPGSESAGRSSAWGEGQAGGCSPRIRRRGGSPRIRRRGGCSLRIPRPGFPRSRGSPSPVPVPPLRPARCRQRALAARQRRGAAPPPQPQPRPPTLRAAPSRARVLPPSPGSSAVSQPASPPPPDRCRLPLPAAGPRGAAVPPAPPGAAPGPGP